LKEQYPEKRAVGRPGLQYLKQVARYTAADSYTAMERMACNSSRWKTANQSKDWGIRRRYIYLFTLCLMMLSVAEAA
jgi:hypothetical protein